VADGNPTESIEVGGESISSSRIHFRYEDTFEGRFNCIRIWPVAGQGQSIIRNCSIEECNTAIVFQNCTPVIENNFIKDCKFGIYGFLNSNTAIDEKYSIHMNVIENFEAKGIWLDMSTNSQVFTINNNILYTPHPGYIEGIHVKCNFDNIVIPDGYFLIENNVIRGIADGTGIWMEETGEVDIRNNIIVDCYEGIDSDCAWISEEDHGVALIEDNCLNNNDINYQWVPGREATFSINEATMILDDPLFVGGEPGEPFDYHLYIDPNPAFSSPCIDEGTVEITAPVERNYHDHLDLTQNDIGAFGDDGMFTIRGEIFGNLPAFWGPYKVYSTDYTVEAGQLLVLYNNLTVNTETERDRLYIEPGTNISIAKRNTAPNFDTELGADVFGHLIAEGTEEEMIVLRALPPEVDTDYDDWDEITFDTAPSSITNLTYCNIENSAGISLFNETDLPLGVSNCIFTDNRDNYVFEIDNSVINIAHNEIYGGLCGFYVYNSDFTNRSISYNTMYDMGLGALDASISTADFQYNTLDGWRLVPGDLNPAIYLYRSAGLIKGNVISPPDGYQSLNTFGIYAHISEGPVYIIDNNIDGGEVTNIGIWLYGSAYDNVVRGNTIIDISNSDLGTESCGVYLYSSSVISFRDNYLQWCDFYGLQLSSYSELYMNERRGNDISNNNDGEGWYNIYVEAWSYLNMDYGYNDIEGDGMLGFNHPDNDPVPAKMNWWDNPQGPFDPTTGASLLNDLDQWIWEDCCEDQNVTINSIEPDYDLFVEGQECQEYLDFPGALNAYEELIEVYPYSDWAVRALAPILSCHIEYYEDEAGALDYFQEIEEEYGTEPLGFEATLMMSKCNTHAADFITALDICDEAQNSAGTLPQYVDALYEEAYCELIQDVTGPGIQSASGSDQIVANYEAKLEEIARIASGETPWTPPVEVTDFALEVNYPNPFNNETVIPYALPEQSEVTIKIFNSLGREVTTLVDGIRNPGVMQTKWNAEKVSSGIYFVKMEAKPLAGGTPFSSTNKLISDYYFSLSTTIKSPFLFS